MSYQRGGGKCIKGSALGKGFGGSKITKRVHQEPARARKTIRAAIGGVLSAAAHASRQAQAMQAEYLEGEAEIKRRAMATELEY